MTIIMTFSYDCNLWRVYNDISLHALNHMSHAFMPHAKVFINNIYIVLYTYILLSF